MVITKVLQTDLLKPLEDLVLVRVLLLALLHHRPQIEGEGCEPSPWLLQDICHVRDDLSLKLDITLCGDYIQ